MKPWMETFILPCLSGISDLSYQRRLSKELADHLEALAHDLEEAGMPPPQAQAAALSRMGDPVQLSRHFREQWLCHIRTPRYVISRLWLGCLATGLFYLILLFPLSALGLMPYDFVPGLSSVARMLLVGVSGHLLFLVSFSLGAVLLSRSFLDHPRLPLLVTAGLLLAWLGEKCFIFLFSGFLYSLSPLNPLPLLNRISGGSDPTAPWFTPVYLCVTLLLCPILGVLISCYIKHKNFPFIPKAGLPI